LGYGKSVGDGKGEAVNSAKAQSTYVNLIRNRILARRQYPQLARQRREEGVVRLRFTLSSGGSLQGVQVVTPSGSQLLDDQARQCVLSAGPFPSFPLDLRRDSLTLEVPIVYKLTEMGM
jgi:protein TonB